MNGNRVIQAAPAARPMMMPLDVTINSGSFINFLTYFLLVLLALLLICLFCVLSSRGCENFKDEYGAVSPGGAVRSPVALPASRASIRRSLSRAASQRPSLVDLLRYGPGEAMA